MVLAGYCFRFELVDLHSKESKQQQTMMHTLAMAVHMDKQMYHDSDSSSDHVAHEVNWTKQEE